jgi:hypothetical protein
MQPTHKKIAWLLGLCASLLVQAGAQDLDAFVRGASDQIQSFLKDQVDVRCAIVRLENASDLSENAVQHLYQVLASALEANPHLHFSDLMVGFSGNQAEFNLRTGADFTFWIDVKLLRNGAKLGLGLTIFSKRLDKIVFLKYLETMLAKGELDLLNTRSYVFNELGFAKILEIDARPDLLDVASLAGASGETAYYFLYPREIACYQARQGRLEKTRALPLSWGRPYYPSQTPCGRLLICKTETAVFLCAGTNSSPRAQIFQLKGDAWEPWSQVEFLPLKLARVNQTLFLIGARYEPGTDLFKDKLYFLPFAADNPGGQIYEKKLLPFYNADLAVSDGQLTAVHVVDNHYRTHVYGPDLAETPLDETPKGVALAVLDNRWLALSDYTSREDHLYFYALGNGARRQVYSAAVGAEIVFLSAGSWGEVGGFWALLRNVANPQKPVLLQFWGKK